MKKQLAFLAVPLVCVTAAHAASNVDISAALVKAINQNPKVLEKALFGDAAGPLYKNVKATAVSKVRLAGTAPVKYQWTIKNEYLPLAETGIEGLNCSDAPQQATISFSETKTSELTHEFSYGFSQRVSASVSGSLGPAEVGVEVEFAANQQITNSRTEVDEYNLTASMPLNQNPRTFQTAQMQVYTSTANGTFSVPVVASGKAEIDAEYKMDTGFVKIRMTGDKMLDLAKLIPDASKRAFLLTGKASGVSYGAAKVYSSPTVDLSKDPARAKELCGTAFQPAATGAPALRRASSTAQVRRIVGTGKPLKPLANGKLVAEVVPKVTRKGKK